MSTSDAKQALVQVEDLKKYFPVTGASVFGRHRSDIRAVDGLSFEIYRGETLGLVGKAAVGNPRQAAPFCSSIGLRPAMYVLTA